MVERFVADDDNVQMCVPLLVYISAAKNMSPMENFAQKNVH